MYILSCTHIRIHAPYKMEHYLTSDILYFFWIYVLYNTLTHKLKCQIRESTQSCFMTLYFLGTKLAECDTQIRSLEIHTKAGKNIYIFSMCEWIVTEEVLCSENSLTLLKPSSPSSPFALKTALLVSSISVLLLT